MTEKKGIIGRLGSLSQQEVQAQRDLQKLAERNALEKSLQDAREELAKRRRQYDRQAARNDDLPSWAKDASRKSLVRQIRSLEHDISNVRLASGATRRNILQRMRRSEQRYNELYKKLTRRNPTVGVGNLYHPRTPRNKGMLDVRVEISLDGRHFSNPAPTIPGGSVIYVRTVITSTEASESAMDALPIELLLLKWKIPAGYTKLDPLYKWGHHVFFVSNPLIITRKFTAPGSNTKKNWMVIARVMEPRDG